jgi:hypothetical protein
MKNPAPRNQEKQRPPISEEIPAVRWRAFLDGIHSRHRGHPVAVEVRDPELGTQVVALHAVLDGISAGLEEDGQDIVLLTFHRVPHHPVEEITIQPKRIWVERDRLGADRSVEIDGKTNHVLLSMQPVNVET